MGTPLQIHPDNPHCFLFRGEPRALVTATEHYGAVMNRPFRFEPYLEDCARRGITVTRLFTLFRELQSACNPYSTCKPESPDYVAPFARTGPGDALDLQPRFDLDQANPEFYDRLHRFLTLASDYGVAVEVVMLSNAYGPDVWALNPLHASNNVNGLEPVTWWDYMSTRNERLFHYQREHVRRIVMETRGYDNVFYEACNEPGGGFPAPGAPTPGEVNDWLAALLAVVREADVPGPGSHLTAGQEAFAYQVAGLDEPVTDVFQFADTTYDELDYDIVNMHPLSNMRLDGERRDLGRFMRGELRLRQLRDYCLALYGRGKPLNLDEDNAATQYKNDFGWTLHRKRAWAALLCGAHYDMIDFSIIPYLETGTPDSQTAIRSYIQHLSQFIHSFDLARAKPLPDMVTSAPDPCVALAHGDADRDVAVYLADGRERDEPGCGEKITGAIRLRLPVGSWRAGSFCPKRGTYSPRIKLDSAGDVQIDLPDFVHDIALRFERLG